MASEFRQGLLASVRITVAVLVSYFSVGALVFALALPDGVLYGSLSGVTIASVVGGLVMEDRIKWRFLRLVGASLLVGTVSAVVGAVGWLVPSTMLAGGIAGVLSMGRVRRNTVLAAVAAIGGSTLDRPVVIVVAVVVIWLVGHGLGWIARRILS
jgi:hypothetical protein